MKTALLKHATIVLITVATTCAANAQSNSYERYNNYDSLNTNTPGKVKETIHTFYNNNEYKIETVNGVLCALAVNGEKIPAEKFSQYDAVIAGIKEQIEKDEAQAKLDRAQADKDREQARKDREQADKDRAQARLDQLQADKDREQARRDREQADKDREQARLDQQQSIKEREQADKDREQAKLDQQQAIKDREQADKDRAQAVIDREQADKDRAQAAEDRKLMRQMLADIIADGIAPNEKSISCITLDSKGMTVNGKQQPDTVFEKYKEKYSRWAENNFSYGGNQQSFMGVHMSRISVY